MTYHRPGLERSSALNSSTGSSAASTSATGASASASAASASATGSASPGTSTATPTSATSASDAASTASCSVDSSDSSDTVPTCFLSTDVTLMERTLRLARGEWGSAAERPEDESPDPHVEQRDECHDGPDERQHHTRVGDQLLARRAHHLLELRGHLADEQGDAARQAELHDTLAAGLLRTRAGRALGAGRRSGRGFAHRHVLTRRSSCRCGRDDLQAVRTTRMRRPHAQGRRDSNPQPPVLETGALPIAPLPYRDNNRCAEHDPSGARRLPGMTHHGGCQPPGVECTWSRRLGRTHPSTRSSRPDSVAREHQPLTRRTRESATMSYTHLRATRLGMIS